MATKKRKPRHDHRGDGGRFAQRPQTGTPIPSPLQQAMLAGATPGWWISDHMEELRHFVSWIYVGVHKVAQQWAQASVCVYDESAEEMYGGNPQGYSPQVRELGAYLRRMRIKSVAPDDHAKHQTPVPDHPAAKLLDRPNPYTSGKVWRYQAACQLRLTGGTYIWEVPNQFGQPEHLWVIPRAWARPMVPNGLYPEGYYQITPVFNTLTQNIASPYTTTFNVPYSQMITVGYPSPLYPGEYTSPLSACNRIIDIMEQTDMATWSSFVNAVKPSLVFNIDPKSGQMPPKEQIDRFLAELEAFKAGASNHGKILAMLGLTVQQLMAGPSELDYVSGREQLQNQVLAIQGVAPVMSGLSGAASYSEAAVQAKASVEFSIAPDLDIFGDSLTHRWQPIWGDDFRIEFDPKNFDDPTIKLQRQDKVAAAFQAGVASANEYRAELDLPPLEDPIADIPQILLQPMLQAPGGPDTGMPGMGDADDPYSAFEGMDLEDDEGDDESTGMRNPLMQEAAGNRMGKAFSLNGHHKNGHA